MRYDFAPMEGVTGWRFRQVHHKYFPGVDRYFIPFLSPTEGHRFGAKELRELDPARNAGCHAVPQFLTKNSADFLWAAGVARDLGYDEVNLNLGCPSGTVVAKGKGAGMLADIAGLDAFLSEVFARAPVAVSVKTRLGLAEEGEFPRLLEVYEKYPIHELIIHPRVRADFYRGPVRRAAFDRAAEQSRLPLVYNGDIFTPGDAAAVEVRFPGIRGVMLGRGLAADPALARRAKGGPPADRGTLRAFHDELWQSYRQDFGSDRNAMLRMKELWSYLIARFQGAGKLEKQLKKVASVQDYEAAVDSIFRSLPLTDEPE